MTLTFKQFTLLAEASNPIHVTMTLQQVIDAGKITNSVQAVIIAQVIENLKHEPDPIVRNINEYPAFSSSNINALKNLPPEDQVELARSLLNQINREFDIRSGSPDPTSSSPAWINSVLQPQK